MKIDRSRYEIWLIDWLDGNLSDRDAEELRLFLNENPDLKTEAEDLEICRLTSDSASLQSKEHLRKSVSDISAEQFEYLSAASHEKDISPAQQEELDEIMSNDPARKAIYETIGRLRLMPENIVYRHKHRLLRRTPAARIIRMAMMTVSAAAVITLLISLLLLTPKDLPELNLNSAQLVPSDSFSEPSEENNTARAVRQKKETLVVEETEPVYLVSARPLPAETSERNTVAPDTASAEERVPVIIINPPEMIAVNKSIRLAEGLLPNSLAVSSISAPEYEEEDDRSSIGRFIARNFREKLLREEAPADSPLKGFEIAEAGVAGINKIFGWEMALDKNNNKEGELKSVYFSSRLLKFNAPVKKAEPLP